MASPTPKLFGYTHDEEGELQINPRRGADGQAHVLISICTAIPHLQIADTLIAQERLVLISGKAMLDSQRRRFSTSQ